MNFSTKSLLTLAVALALAGHAASALNVYKVSKYCRYVDSQTRPNAENATSAYESAMEEVRSLDSQTIEWRNYLADGWRAVTFDEPCAPMSLAYVSIIYACQPDGNPTQQFLARDVRKYAQKCLTPNYLEEMFKAHTRGLFGADPTGLESFLTSDLLAAYRRANPDEPTVHFTVQVGANCCQPLRALQVLAKDLEEKFPQETAKFSGVKTDKALKRLGKFLKRRLYKPCVNYVRLVQDSLMDGVKAAAHYVLNDNLGQLSPGFQDAIFRYKFCQNFELPTNRARFNELMMGAFK